MADRKPTADKPTDTDTPPAAPPAAPGDVVTISGADVPRTVAEDLAAQGHTAAAEALAN